MNELEKLGLELSKLSLCLGNVIDNQQNFNIMYNDEIIGYGFTNSITGWAHCNLTLSKDYSNTLNAEAEAEYALEILIEENKIKLFVL